MSSETIASIATASSRQAGIGIIRLSGNQSLSIAKTILKKEPKPRYAHFLPFFNEHNEIIDQGICLYFPSPNSMTGEDIIELQGHGGSIVIDMLLKRVLQLGARQANPGEFLERAFLNNKIDLAQAEAIADLIEASSEQAARSAVRSMSGQFSERIHELVEALIELRMYVESAIDFPEEEIDFLSDGKIYSMTENIQLSLQDTLEKASQGVLLKEGISLAITGQPNVGKSSLLNYLSGEDTAIVTDIAGTTRDVIKKEINLDGLPLHIIDTAGLRESNCQVEQIGIQRAWDEIKKADLVLLMVNAQQGLDSYDHQVLETIAREKIIIIYNKIDLTDKKPEIKTSDTTTEIFLSIKNELGMEQLISFVKEKVGYETKTEGIFSARRRHLDSMEKAHLCIKNGLIQLEQFKAGELLAAELSQAQQYLSEITGEFSSDDLLGKIFSGFCIGK